MTRLILCDGIGEHQRAGSMLSQADWSAFDEVIHLDWAASYAVVNPNHDPFGPAFMASMRGGITSLRHLLDDKRAVVAGYSGGAGVAGHVAAQGHPNMEAVALLADPFQPRAASSDGHWGVAGARPVNGKTVRWFWTAADIIPHCDGNSPIRTFADQSVAFSLGDVAAWQADVVGRLKSARWQAVRVDWRNPLGVWRQYIEAVASVELYLGIARDPRPPWAPIPCPHTSYANTGVVENLAAWCGRFA